jgi:hypothetical protein
MNAEPEPHIGLIRIYPSFVQIVRHHMVQLVAQEHELKQALQQTPASASELYRRTGHLVGYNEQDAVITIVFAAMAVEAMIYAYIEDRFGEHVFTEEFEPLSIPQRWAKLIASETGAAHPKSTPTFKMLSQLVRNRNKLVHFRTIVVNLQSEADIMRTFRDYNWLSQAKQAVEAIDAVLADLTALDPKSEFAALLQPNKSNTSETAEEQGQR